MAIIKNKNILFSAVASALVYPFISFGFLTACFPVSFVLLSFIAAWPSPLLYEVFGLQNLYLGIAMGLVVDTIIIYFLGSYLDKKKRTKSQYRIKFLKYFGVLVVLLIGLTFIDPTCWS